MQFFAVILAAAMASVAAAQSTVTVYACAPTSITSGVAKPTVKPTTVASTGVAPTPTGQPKFTGAASMNAPALGMIVVGGLALFL